MLFIVTVLAAAPVLYPAPAVERSWGSNGTQTVHGYVNRAGKMILEPRWDVAGRFQEGYAVVTNREWYEGSVSGPHEPQPESLIDAAGAVVMTHRYISPVSEGRVVIADEVDGVLRFGWVEVATGAGSGLIYARLAPFASGLAPVQVAASDGGPPRWGYLNREGKVVIPPRFDEAYGFTGGVAKFAVSDGGRRFGLVDASGKVVVEPRYLELEYGADEWIVVREPGNAYRYLDRRGRAVKLTQPFEYATPFREGFAVAALRNKDHTVDYGYLRRDGTWLVRLHSPGSSFPAEAMGFNEGAGVVPDYQGIGWSYWYVSASGKKLFDRSFVDAAPFTDGLALVSYWKDKTLRHAYLDPKGVEVWQGPVRAEQ